MSVENCQCDVGPSPHSREGGVYVPVLGGSPLMLSSWHEGLPQRASFVGETTREDRLVEAAWAAEWAALFRCHCSPGGPRGRASVCPGPRQKGLPGHLEALPWKNES